MNLAQPALGMQIKQLEEELGIKLFARHSRGVSPTAAGKLLYRHAHRILDAVEQARHEVSTLKSQKPLQLRLGVNPSMVEVLGSDLLREAKAILPDIKISLTEDRSRALLDALEQRQLDIALLYNINDRPDLVRRALIEEDLLFLSAARKSKKTEPISFSHVLRSELAIGGERSVVRSLVETEARRLSLDVRLAYEVHSLSSMMTIVRRGEASTIMPYANSIKDIRKGTLVGRPIKSPHLTRTMYAVYQRAHLPILEDDRVMRYVGMLVQSYLDGILPYGRVISELQRPEKPAGRRSDSRAGRKRLLKSH